MGSFMDEIDAKVARVKKTVHRLHDEGWSNGKILDHLLQVEGVDNMTISDVAWEIREGRKK